MTFNEHRIRVVMPQAFEHRRGEVATGAGVFALSYVTVRALFSLGAALAQWERQACCRRQWR